MLRYLTDEDFAGRIRRGLRRRLPELDLVRVQDVDLAGSDDPTILAWAAADGRVLLSHDVSTMTVYAYDRVAQGLPMPGLFIVPQLAPLGPIIEELLILAECSRDDEWEGRVLHLPL